MTPNTKLCLKQISYNLLICHVKSFLGTFSNCKYNERNVGQRKFTRSTLKWSVACDLTRDRVQLKKKGKKIGSFGEGRFPELKMRPVALCNVYWESGTVTIHFNFVHLCEDLKGYCILLFLEVEACSILWIILVNSEMIYKKWTIRKGTIRKMKSTLKDMCAAPKSLICFQWKHEFFLGFCGKKDTPKFVHTSFHFGNGWMWCNPERVPQKD